MNKGMMALVSGAALMAGLGSAVGEEPMKLTGPQLDGVTAAGPFTFDFAKFVFSDNFELVFTDVDLNGSIGQSTADVQAEFVQIGTGDNDIKVETATFVDIERLPGSIGTVPAVFNSVQSNSLSFVAWESNNND